ncbi:MAG: hypothetical protein ACFWTS_06975 [Pseudoclavibacter caeni]
MTIHDCIVVGGGPAGQSAALVLARARRDVLVIDGNRPRNRATYMSHGFITRDGTPPMRLRELGREDLARYPNVTFQWGEVVAVAGGDGDFTVTVTGVRGGPSGEVRARKILLATGVQETLPAVPDLIGYYGSSIFSCVHCDGWERREQSLVVMGRTPSSSTRPSGRRSGPIRRSCSRTAAASSRPRRPRCSAGAASSSTTHRSCICAAITGRSPASSSPTAGSSRPPAASCSRSGACRSSSPSSCRPRRISAG